MRNTAVNGPRLTPPASPGEKPAIRGPHDQSNTLSGLEAMPIRVPTRRWVRGLWMVLGLGACGLGGVGLVVPGLPSTVFFILAAYCFSRSSDRLLRWVLRLPKVGPMVRDYREGRGIPRAVKKAALLTMAVVGTLSLVVLPVLWLKALVLGLLLIGASVVWWGVPSTPATPGASSGPSSP